MKKILLLLAFWFACPVFAQEAQSVLVTKDEAIEIAQKIIAERGLSLEVDMDSVKSDCVWVVFFPNTSPPNLDPETLKGNYMSRVVYVPADGTAPWVFPDTP
ncbi:MAG: hypothetical protein ACRCWR_07710 [Saezia sp.]